MKIEGFKKLERKWYILRGENKYGPFEYGAMLAMIQKGEIQDYNYVWAEGVENWTLLGEIPEFSKDRLALLINTKDPISHAFLQRAADRADVKLPVYAHNDQHFFDGQCISVSENGALVLLNNPMLQPGQNIFLHFRSSEVVQNSFNVFAQIVRKNFSRQRLNVKSGLNYAIRFVKVQETGKKEILSLIKNYHEYRRSEQ
jgi:hypothetical protein